MRPIYLTRKESVFQPLYIDILHPMSLAHSLFDDVVQNFTLAYSLFETFDDESILQQNDALLTVDNVIFQSSIRKASKCCPFGQGH